MAFIEDEGGQGVAEYILIFGGVIVIVLVAFLIYRNYIRAVSSLNATSDINKVRTTIK